MARECRRPVLTMSQVEKMPGVGEEVEGEVEDQAPGFPRSFAAVVKSAKFLEKINEQEKEAASLKQVQEARKVQVERTKEKERTDREATKLAEETKKRKDAEEKRREKLEKLAAAAKEAEDYNEKVKSLHKKTQEEWREAQELENKMEKMSTDGGAEFSGKTPKRLRPGSTSTLQAGLPPPSQ